MTSRHDIDNVKVAKSAWWLLFLGQGFSTYGATESVFKALGDAFSIGGLWLLMYLIFFWGFLPIFDDWGRHAMKLEQEEGESE